MSADVRDVTTEESEGTSTIARPATVAGDVMFLFASTWVDPMDELGPPSGGWGEPIAERQGVDNGGAKLWRKVVTSGEPDFYTVPVPEDFADATLAILAVKGADPTAIQVTTTGPSGVTSSPSTPAITPDVASSLEIRFVSGVPDGPDPATSLTAPAGYEQRADQRRTFFVLSALATRTLTSSTPISAQVFAAVDGRVRNHVGFTIVIGSRAGGSSSGPPPAPPQFPAFVPTRGLATMRYMVHDFLTGEYRGEITPVDPSLDRREGEAGTWNGFLPIPIDNRREANKIREMFPDDPEDLSSGVGRLIVHSWRADDIVGVHWLHTVIPARSSKLGLGLTLQGSTLDAYMSSVAITEDIELTGDQFDVARSLVLHMGTDPRSNPGFALQTETSGVVRPLTARGDGTAFYGKVLRDYAKASDGFGFVVNPTVSGGSLERRLDMGSPYLSVDEEYLFDEAREGGEITDWQEITSALAGGTRFGIIGGTPAAEDATQGSEPVRSTLIETPHLLAGWPIIDQRLQHPLASTELTELERFGAYYARTAAGAPRVFSANVILGKDTPFNFNHIGAMTRFKLNNAYHGSGAERRRRLIGWSLTPASRTFGKDRLGLIAAQEVPEL